MIVESILDNDLYKFSMQQAVLQRYPRETKVVYQFKNRKPAQFPFKDVKIVDALRQRLDDLKRISLTADELSWLKSSCPYFTPTYLDYLAAFRFNPSAHIALTHDPITESISIYISGAWHETILYEVPVMAIVSETYFELVDTNWIQDTAGQSQLAYTKTKRLIAAGCAFSEFGTRRRRSRATQDIVVAALCRAQTDVNRMETKNNPSRMFVGTSNVHFAQKYGIPVVGTVAHEWTMAVSALCGDLLHANAHALAEWLVVYPASTGYFNTALADTFGTPAFLVDFTAPLSSMPTIEAVVKASSSSSSSKADTSTTLAHLYAGVRQDSGDPAVFIRRVVAAYKRAGIDPADKAIIFSDSLTVDRCIAIRDMCAADSADIESGGGGGIQAKFGIGTHFTNDFQKRVDVNSGNDTMTAATTTNTKSPAMDIVVKLFQVDGKHVVKLSDNPSGKFQGDSAAVDLALKTFGVNLDL